MFMMMRIVKEIEELKKMEAHSQVHTPLPHRFSPIIPNHLRHRAQNITHDITPRRIDFEDEFNNTHIIEDNLVG